MDVIATIHEQMKGLFPDLLGVRLLEASQERVVANLTVRSDLCTAGGILHGGAIMAFADTLGAVATVLNLPPGARTTTIESKTNFISSAHVGAEIKGECAAFHRGRRTMVWQTKLMSAEGRLIAVVTQTQMVIES
jgi:uncharacterized protein (TIGR00369 family)